MKKIYFSIVLFGVICMGTPASSQTVAMDFTRNDCNGASHHLFSELDAGNVIVLDYIMLGCSSCIVATNALKSLVAPFEISHPGRVHIYSIGYSNSYTCSQMLNWMTANGYNHQPFTGGATEVAYYGGMGMPTIVVVAGNTHSVLYKKLGYVTGDNAAILTALNAGLAMGSSGVDETLAEKGIHIFPTLVDQHFSIHSARNEPLSIKVLDIQGRTLINIPLEPMGETMISTSSFTPGVYLARIEGSKGVLGTRKLLVH